MQELQTIMFSFSLSSTVECYDPAKNEWKFVASMNNQRDGACVVTEGRYIYVISGYDGQSYLSSVEMYDPSTDDWALGGKATSFYFCVTFPDSYPTVELHISFLSLSESLGLRFTAATCTCRCCHGYFDRE